MATWETWTEDPWSIITPPVFPKKQVFFLLFFFHCFLFVLCLRELPATESQKSFSEGTNFLLILYQKLSPSSSSSSVFCFSTALFVGFFKVIFLALLRNWFDNNVLFFFLPLPRFGIYCGIYEMGFLNMRFLMCVGN